jgi:hypothetical protein
MAAEEMLKQQWHDPRFGLRLAIGFLQLLQDPEMTSTKVAELDVLQTKPIERL